MGQILGQDNVPDIAVASNTSLTLATTNLGKPTRITVGGQQYAPSAIITLNTGTTGFNGLDTGALAANTQYYVYAVTSSGILGMVLSTASPTTGPTGFTVWETIGIAKTKTGAAELLTVSNWKNYAGTIQSQRPSRLVFKATGEAYGGSPAPGNSLPSSQITGLVVGRTYRLTARIVFRIDSGGFSAQTIHCLAYHNGAEIARSSMRFDSASAADTDMGSNMNCVFTAAATTLDFYSFGGSVSRVRGSQIIVEEYSEDIPSAF